MANKALSIKANMLWNSIGSTVYLACQWAITILIVRLSGDFLAAGALALGMTISNVFSPIGYYKIRAYQVSDVRNEYSSSQYIGFRFFTIGLSLIAMLIYTALTCSPNIIISVLLYGIYSCGPIAVDVLHGIDQKQYRMDIIGKSLIFRGFLSVVGFTIAFHFTDSLNFTLLVMILLTFSIVILYDIPKTKNLALIAPDFSRDPIIKLLITCLPLVIASFFISAAPAIPRQLLNDIYGSAALGAYASVASPIAIVQMGAQYIYSPILGVFAEAFITKNSGSFLRLLAKTTIAITGFTLITVVVFVLFGSDLLALLYGDEIRDYTNLLTPLILCTSLTAFIWFFGDILIVIRKPKHNLIAYLLTFAVAGITSYPFLIEFGLNGANYALIAGFCTGLTYCSICIFKCCASMKRTSV